MTTNYTAFINLLAQAWPDTVTDCETSTAFAQMKDQVRYNVQRRKIEEITLNAAQTYTLTLASLAVADWHVLMVTCRGAVPATGPTGAYAAQGYISTAGHAYDNSTALTGIIPLYGVTLATGIVVPGIAILSTYNLTAAPVITSQLNGSIFTIYDLLAVEDGA